MNGADCPLNLHLPKVDRCCKCGEALDPTGLDNFGEHLWLGRRGKDYCHSCYKRWLRADNGGASYSAATT